MSTSVDRATHCAAGHEFSDANTMRRPSGGRRCRQCAREYNARWKKELRANKPADELPLGNGSGLLDILASVVRTAIEDYRNGYHSQRHPEAAVFLRQVGILREDGTLDTFGHVMSGPKARRKVTP